MKTSERLAQALHARGEFEMEKRVRSGYYGEPISPPPKQLVGDLTARGHKDLAPEQQTRRKYRMRRGVGNFTKFCPECGERRIAEAHGCAHCGFIWAHYYRIIVVPTKLLDL